MQGLPPHSPTRRWSFISKPRSKNIAGLLRHPPWCRHRGPRHSWGRVRFGENCKLYIYIHILYMVYIYIITFLYDMLKSINKFCTILLWIWVFSLYTLKYMNTVCLFGCDPEAPAYGLNIRSGTIFQILEDTTSNPWVLVFVLSLLLIVIIIVIIASVYLRLFLLLSWLQLVFFIPSLWKGSRLGTGMAYTQDMLHPHQQCYFQMPPLNITKYCI